MPLRRVGDNIGWDERTKSATRAPLPPQSKSHTEKIWQRKRKTFSGQDPNFNKCFQAVFQYTRQRYITLRIVIYNICQPIRYEKKTNLKSCSLMGRSCFSYHHCHLGSLSPIAPNFGFIDSSTEKGGGTFFKLFKQADLLKLKDKISLGIIPNSDKKWQMRDVKEDFTEGESKGCSVMA